MIATQLLIGFIIRFYLGAWPHTEIDMVDKSDFPAHFYHFITFSFGWQPLTWVNMSI